MAVVGLSTKELSVLCALLSTASDGSCLPDWEFESLVGIAPSAALGWIGAGLPGAELDEQLLDRVVTMLSILVGAGRGAGLGERLLERLFWSSDEQRATRADQQSSVTVRKPTRDSTATAPRAVRKRRAVRA